MGKNLAQFHSPAHQNLQKKKKTLDVSFKTWLNMLIILNTSLLHESIQALISTKSDEYIKKCTFTNILKINYL